jgi:plasmid stabilization system protein ParE
VPQVIWTEAALADTQRHYEFLAAIAPDAALRAKKAIQRSGNSLAASPQRGSVVQKKEGLRKLPVKFGKYGFVIHYVILVDIDEVIILKVYGGRENRPI